jgi:hypothetical protein
MVTKYKFHRRFYSGDGNFPVGFEEDEGTVIPVPQKKSKGQNGGQDWGLKRVHLAHGGETGYRTECIFHVR